MVTEQVHEHYFKFRSADALVVYRIPITVNCADNVTATAWSDCLFQFLKLFCFLFIADVIALINLSIHSLQCETSTIAAESLNLMQLTPVFSKTLVCE